MIGIRVSWSKSALIACSSMEGHSMWRRTDFIELLDITHPIVQAPMSGFAPPALAAAVSNAGGLGSIGCAGIPTATVRDHVVALRQATNRPFILNFFVHAHPRLDPDATARMRARLSSYFDEFRLGAVPEPKELFPPFGEEQLALVLELRPRVVSFHFGLPDESAVRQVKEAGCLVLSSATTVNEARWLEANGADAIIAQGFEAGGHRGSFSDSPGAGMVGTMALVPQIVDAVRLPVIAAGGIADGRGLAAAFALGAGGAQLGTAFLGCPEATISPLYRAQLRSAVDDGTELSRAYTGRPARALRNRFITEMADNEPLPFPLQASLVGPLWQSPNEQARASFMPFWAGQAAALAKEMPAGQLVEKLVSEARSILEMRR
jgi:nitronate monooxygenase